MKVRKYFYLLHIVVGLPAGLILFNSSAHAYDFTGLGTTSDGEYRAITATDISGDGSVVIGFSSSELQGYSQAFRWSRDSGVEVLGDLPGGSVSSQAYGVSLDGSVIVGTSNSSLGTQAFRWTQDDGMVGMSGGVSGRPINATGVSADGSVIVGDAVSGSLSQGFEVFRAVDSTIAGLGGLEGSVGAIATDVSADGSVVVGRSKSGTTFGWEAFVWTESTGMQGLGFLPGETESNAQAISADGKTVVGSTTINSSVAKGFYWTASSGMLPLETTDPDIIEGVANDVSGDGSVIVGQILSATRGWSGAFVWDQEHGMQNLADLLLAESVDLTGWTLSGALGVSDDGRSIVGWGINPDGLQEAWIVTQPVPLPSSVWLLASSLIALGSLCRRSSAAHGRR